MQPITEVPPDLPAGAASQPPVGFVVVLWIGAFSVMVWGLMVLFRNRRTTAEPPPSRPGSEDTLDE